MIYLSEKCVLFLSNMMLRFFFAAVRKKCCYGVCLAYSPMWFSGAAWFLFDVDCQRNPKSTTTTNTTHPPQQTAEKTTENNGP